MAAEDLVREVLATGLVSVFPWLADEPAARCFVDAAERRGIDLVDAEGLVALAIDMSEEDEVVAP